MDDEFCDHDNIMDDDPALDYILYEEMKNNNPQEGSGCFSTIVMFLLPISALMLVLVRA